TIATLRSPSTIWSVTNRAYRRRRSRPPLLARVEGDAVLLGGRLHRVVLPGRLFARQEPDPGGEERGHDSRDDAVGLRALGSRPFGAARGEPLADAHVRTRAEGQAVRLHVGRNAPVRVEELGVLAECGRVAIGGSDVDVCRLAVADLAAG